MLGWLTSLQLQVFVYIGIYMFLAFKWPIKDKNRLRIEGERNLFTNIRLSLYRVTNPHSANSVKYTIKSELFNIA